MTPFILDHLKPFHRNFWLSSPGKNNAVIVNIFENMPFQASSTYLMSPCILLSPYILLDRSCCTVPMCNVVGRVFLNFLLSVVFLLLRGPEIKVYDTMNLVNCSRWLFNILLMMFLFASVWIIKVLQLKHKLYFMYLYEWGLSCLVRCLYYGGSVPEWK